MTNTLQLTIALLSASIRLSATIPGAGEYWLMSSSDARRLQCSVIAAGRATNICHVTKTIRAKQPNAVYWLEFRATAK